MKGIIFTELLEMIERQYGADFVDDILDQCSLETDGAYTSVGTYDFKELVQILKALSVATNISVSDHIFEYGRYLFPRLIRIVPDSFQIPKSSFGFLEQVHSRIHDQEVKKLYPDAVLPSFDTKRTGDHIMVMTYRSQCPFADFAHGLIQGCVDFYKENIIIEGEDKNTDGEFCRVFTLTKV